MFGPFHRLTTSVEEVREVLRSGEVWGRSPHGIFQSDFPKVKAYDGPLPAGATGYEFMTPVRPDRGHLPGKPTWSAVPLRGGVVGDGRFARIKVQLVKNTVIL